jgi:hypothetical protein
MRVAVSLNPTIATIAAGTFTRLVGGDATLHAEVDRHAARQAHLAHAQPDSLLRAVGEGVEAGAHAAAAAAGEAIADAAIRDRAVAAAIRGDADDAPTARELFNLEQRRLEMQTASLMAQLVQSEAFPDHRDRTLFRTVAVNSTRRLLIAAGPGAGGDAAGATTTEAAAATFLTISDEAVLLGHRLTTAECIRAGKLAARAFQLAHGGCKPLQHRQRMADGSERSVNSYTMADRGIVRAAISDVVAARR